jgi:hypothetical protein
MGTSPETAEESAQQAASGAPLPRWALWLMLPGIAAPLLVLGFILVTQLAHDPARCPYRESGRRSLPGGAVVVEQQRSCLPAVEERRYLLQRGEYSQLLGERRLPERAFADGYRWRAEVSPEGEVKVFVHNDGHGELTFREGKPTTPGGTEKR